MNNGRNEKGWKEGRKEVQEEKVEGWIVKEEVIQLEREGSTKVHGTYRPEAG